ncbi:MAG: Asp-tRNA(Asn)/Glu-tRNA(Gln) amidotransferase subunit GatC [Candidatus Aureabacteria bacterium]|nr:Asp-tRNA(Asn)/Glu-tRNA(Gln) amidotransferase subunit GatC [Candidatus Auribacterota bacterium]
MNIDDKLLDYLSSLSRLKLNDEEKKVITPQLKDIVEYIEKLGEIDADNVEAMDHILDIKNVYRDDVAHDSYKREDIVKNAPKTDGEFFEVPKIL